MGAALAPALCHAQPDYSWELSGLAVNGPNQSRFAARSVSATHFFGGIEEGDGPHALSTFLDPASFVSATFDRADDERDIWIIAGRYLVAGSRWYVGGRYSHPRLTVNDPTFVELRAKDYGIVAGKYLGPRTTLELGIDRARTESLQDVPVTCFQPLCPILPIATVSKGETERLSFTHVRQFRALTYAFDGGYWQHDSRITQTTTATLPGLNLLPWEAPTVHTYALGATLYPMRTLGVRLEHEQADDEFTDGAWLVGARWFIRRNVALELSFSQRKYTAPAPFDERADIHNLSVIGRF